MWQLDYSERLQQWNHLRTLSKGQNAQKFLLDINDWWWQAPITGRSSLTQDISTWPSPWELISQQGFCDLARALGMLYTVMMLEQFDLEKIYLCQTKDNNLVEIDDGKYILNWCPGTIVNIPLNANIVYRRIGSKKLQSIIG
jgi:hypothetical protein